MPRFDAHIKNYTNHVIYPRSTQAYSDSRTSTWVNQKGYITHALGFNTHLKILIMLYIPEALRHTGMPGHQSRWTRKDIKHIPRLNVHLKTLIIVLCNTEEVPASFIWKCQDLSRDELARIKKHSFLNMLICTLTEYRTSPF